MIANLELKSNKIYKIIIENEKSFFHQGEGIANHHRPTNGELKLGVRVTFQQNQVQQDDRHKHGFVFLTQRMMQLQMEDRCKQVSRDSRALWNR